MGQIELKLVFFGELKKYFSESMTLSVTKGSNLNDVVDVLIDMNENSRNSLAVSQLAIDSSMVNRQFVVNESHEIILLPPFSGG